MKRISVAEQTLKKQIEQFKRQRQFLFTEIGKVQTQIDTYGNLIAQLENEQDRLEQQRKSASDRVHGRNKTDV